MKAFLFFIVLLSFKITLFGQANPERDRLLQVLKAATHDSTKIQELCRLSRNEKHNQVKSYNYINQALTLARKSKLKIGEALCYLTLGDFYARSDYAKALEYRLKSLHISEALGNDVYIANALFAIGNGYRLQEYPTKALPYFFKAEGIFKAVHSPELVNNYNLLGICYEKLGKSDSALYYFNRGYEMAHLGKPVYTIRLLRGLGNVYTIKGDMEVAFSFYRKSIAEATAANEPDELCQNYIQLSKLFAKTNSHDSALLYGTKAMQLAQSRNSRTLTSWAANQLANLYETTEPREALRYYKLSATIKDEIFGAGTQAQIQNLTFAELERQREIEEAKQKAMEGRKHNLQYAAIALVIVALLIAFLVFSHSVIANQKLIKFLGVVSLLIVFEFFNLLLHPWLGNITHHSPVLMLLFMICVAALLVPLHHKLEHWVTHKLVEKNNKIRLAAAKKTIKQLEQKQTQEL